MEELGDVAGALQAMQQARQTTSGGEFEGEINSNLLVRRSLCSSFLFLRLFLLFFVILFFIFTLNPFSVCLHSFPNILPALHYSFFFPFHFSVLKI